MGNKKQITLADGERGEVIPDGAVCRKAYFNASIRVVHLLKEATHGGALGPNLLNTIYDNGTVKWRLWKVTARRSYALQNQLPDWSDLPADAFGHALRISAVLNLNDTIPYGVEGRYSSNDKEVLAHALTRWDKRRAAILELKPSVVVCAGTYRLTRQLLEEYGERWEDKGEAMLWEGIPLLKAHHPSFRRKRHEEEYEEFRQRCRGAKDIMSAIRLDQSHSSPCQACLLPKED